MTADPADHLFALLLRQAAPLVLAPPEPYPRLGGIARAGSDRARMFLTGGSLPTPGIGIEFRLASDRGELPIELALDWIRTFSASPDLLRVVEQPGKTTDSHGYRIIEAATAGFRPDQMSPRFDHNIFAILSILVHGGGFPWFEDVYTCAGFLITGPQLLRIYVRVTSTGEIYGIEIPLASSSGEVVPGMGGSFPQELASVIRNGTLAQQPQIDIEDDYCTTVYDMTAWVDG
jgi:hypothetical protein